MIMEKIEKLNNFILKNMLFLIVIFVLVYIFMGFGESNVQPVDSFQYGGVSNRAMMVNDSAPAPMMMSVRSKAAGSNDSKVVRTFSLSIESKNVDNAKEKVEKEIESVNGVVDSFYSYTYFGNELAYNFTLKIPTDRFEEVINNFKKLGIIKSESSSALDITEQYRDNANRLTNLYARRDRLRKMMENKTEKLADIIAVDRELNNVQNEIEMLENANRNIDNNVSYSRLDLSILPELKIDDFNSSKWQVSVSWKKAVNKLVIFGQKAIDFAFTVAVFVPVLAGFVILFIVVKFIIVKTRRNSSN